jgi:hypothetical protein
MTRFDILYEIGEEDANSDGGRLAEIFLERFLEDVNGLSHEVTTVTNDLNEWSVMATIETRARVTDEWFENADVAIKV